MHKKLISLAVAASFVAPMAMADLVAYGKVHMDIVATDDNSTTNNIETTSNSSRLGIKGSEDLGDGLKAIFKYEMTYSGVEDNNDGTDSKTSIGDARNSYIGLASDFGTFILGRRDTPAKSALYAAGNDHLGDSIIDFAKVGFTENRAANSIAYISPNVSGFKMAAAIVPGEQSGADQLNDQNGLMDSYSLGVIYKGSGVKFGAGYEKMADKDTASATNNDAKTMQIGASYTMSNITIGAQYSNDDNYQHADSEERTTWAVAGKVRFGNNAVIANYGNTRHEDANGTIVTGSDTNHAGIALQHSMSKRTSVYVAFKNEDVDNDIDSDKFAVGMVHKF